MTVTITKAPRSKPRSHAKKMLTAAREATFKVASDPRSGRKQRAGGGNITADASGMVTSAASLLGEDGGKYLSAFEWATVARRGVQPAALEALTGFLDVSQADLSSALDIPVRTLIRRKSKERLNPEESAKLVRVARVIERAEEVFDGSTAARDWLKRANAALDGETPISLLDTEFGAETVMDTLGRIEHGVFA